MNDRKTTAGFVMLATAMVLWMAGCGGAPSVTPAATVPDRAPTATPAPTQTETAPLAASATPRPTRTETAPPTASATNTSQPQPSDTPPAALPDLAIVPWINGVDLPVFATWAEDGSDDLFVVEKAGAIVVWRNGALESAPFLDIRDRVGSSGSEQGLLGLAFAPDYATSGEFYVNYTDRNGNTVVSRLTRPLQSDVADPATEQVVLRIQQPAANHNGGMLAFGPDGYLYIGTGDGGGANDPSGNGQNPSTLLGKLLRIDVTSAGGEPYAVPPDNPWLGATIAGREVLPEIWAIGLRNPWRFSFDRGTGDLWIGDVGQGRYEEIDRLPAGTGGYNFGWSVMEGAHCLAVGAGCETAGLTLPISEYEHQGGNCSITGGYVYRGAAIPGLTGMYVYGDYCSGAIWGLDPAGDGARNVVLAKTNAEISSFAEDRAGELYVIDLAGTVYRIQEAK